jgi:hypothetical protein
MKLRPVSLALLGLVACRFGGPSADPDAYVSFPVPDAAIEDAQDFGATDATVDPASDAGSLPGSDASGTDDGGDPFLNDDGGTCGSAIVATCNPVQNTGCNGLQQCDVDTSQKTTPTGICVFNSGADAGGTCLTTLFTESCAPKSTCVNGACRALCFCNTDCPTGQCCSDTTGPTGFTLCQACP